MRLNLTIKFGRGKDIIMTSSTLILCSRRLTRLALLLTLVPAPALAQSNASVHGRVVDPSGAVVPAAIVTLRGAGGERTLHATPTGEFTADSLASGEYILIAEAPGFAPAAQTILAIGGRAAWIELSLQVPSLTESVQVVAERIAGTPERISRIPGSVDVIDRATLDTSNVFTVNEALRKVPGLFARDEEGLGLRPNIGLRGTNPTRSSRVLLLEDGIPLTYAPYGDNASYYHPPIDRFESIEVLKGAGQIAYGPMTVGGVINYVTPAPPARSRGSFSFAAGNRDYLNAQGNYGATTGKVGYLFDYMRKQGDGARDNVSSALNDVNGKSVVALTPAQTLTVRGNYYSEDSNVTYSGLRQAEWDAFPRGNAFKNDFFYIDRAGASATHLFAPSGNVALSTTAYTSVFRRHWWRQSSNSGQRPSDASDPNCAGMDNLNTTCGNEGRLRLYRVIGVEPRLHALHELLGVTAEADYGVRVHHEQQDRIQKNGDTPTARDGVIVESNARTNTAVAAFAQQRLSFGKVSVTPGIRVEHVLYSRTNRLRAASGTTSLTQLIPGIGIAHSPSADVTWFAGLHRGFAPPRTEDVINNNTGGVIELDPELSWNFELGARTELRPGVVIDATFFRMDYENQVVPASVAGGVGATLTSGGETLHQGVEGSLRLDTSTLFGLSQNLYLRAALTFVPIARFEGTRFSSIAGFSNVAITGNRLPYAPESLFTIGVGYSFTDRFDALVEAVRVSDQFGDDLNTVAGTPDGQRGLIAAQTTWNAAANYRIPTFDATLFVTVKNVLDTLYIADRSRGLLPGTPRLLQAGVKVRF
jgi:Fe(3+) dicitrate transport protein